jgi:hypothetical protein
MRRQGVEDRKDKPPVIEPLKKPRRKLSKAELREQAEAAFVAWRAGQHNHRPPEDGAGSTQKAYAAPDNTQAAFSWLCALADSVGHRAK